MHGLNISKYVDVLIQVSLKYEVVALIIETWLEDKDMNQFQIKGYHMLYCNRKRRITQARARNSGGILVYVKDCVPDVSVYKTKT